MENKEKLNEFIKMKLQLEAELKVDKEVSRRIFSHEYEFKRTENLLKNVAIIIDYLEREIQREIEIEVDISEDFNLSSYKTALTEIKRRSKTNNEFIERVFKLRGETIAMLARNYDIKQQQSEKQEMALMKRNTELSNNTNRLLEDVRQLKKEIERLNDEKDLITEVLRNVMHI